MDFNLQSKNKDLTLFFIGDGSCVGFIREPRLNKSTLPNFQERFAQQNRKTEQQNKKMKNDQHWIELTSSHCSRTIVREPIEKLTVYRIQVDR